MKIIKLTKNKECIVDDKYYNELLKYKWYTNKGRSKNTFYAETDLRKMVNGKYVGKRLNMHRLVMQLNGYDIKGKRVDHKDRNGLNNQISNLRISTHQENIRNSEKQSNNTSGYKGVSSIKNSYKWRAYINIDKKQISLGRFVNKIDAAKAYDKAALKYFGEFANINGVL